MLPNIAVYASKSNEYALVMISGMMNKIYLKIKL